MNILWNVSRRSSDLCVQRLWKLIALVKQFEESRYYLFTGLIMIGLGNNYITALALGNSSVSAVYLGNNKIWPAGISYKIVNPIVNYSSGSSLKPDKTNYATFTGTLQKYVGDTLESSSEVDLTPAVSSDKVVLEDGKAY